MLKLNNETTLTETEFDGVIPHTPVRFALAMAKKFWAPALLSFVVVTVAEGLSLFLPYVLKRLVDAVSAAGSARMLSDDKLLFWVAAFPVTVALMFFFWRLSGFIAMRWMTRVEIRSHRLLYDYVTRHSHGYFSNRFAGALANKAAHVAEGTFRMLDKTLWGHYQYLLSFIATGAIIATTSFYSGVVFLLLVAILLPVNVMTSKYRRPSVVAYATRNSELKGRVVDVLTNIAATRQYAQREYELRGLDVFLHRCRSADLRQWIQSEWIMVLNNAIITLALALIMVIMYRQWLSGVVTVGDFVLVATLLMNMQRVLTFIGSLFNEFVSIYGQIEEGLQEILIPHSVIDTPMAAPLIVKHGIIQWKSVAFKFDEQSLFKGFDMQIPAGQRVGVVGPSGAGKTTFVSLLLRQYDIDGGEILIDGQNIAKVTQDSLRKQIAVVPQEPLLFHRSIKDNIAYGKPDATTNELIEVARQARADEFICELPDGYDTLVGERGVKLSGGQKQRVAIARAMLKDAPILVLDEATSALDSESEVAIQKALRKLMVGKTVVAIAHRLSTLREMDRLIVLQNGRIVEDGTHDTLVNHGGVYAGLWKHQAGGFLAE